MRSTKVAPDCSSASSRVSEMVSTAILSGMNSLLWSMPGTFSQLGGRESVAALHGAGPKSGIEPALALLRAAMGEAVRHDITLRSPLQGVIADSGRRAQRSLDVARLDERRLALALEIFVLAIRPYARETVGLQLDLDLNVVRLRSAVGG